jgi:N-acetylmuramic acid 6-phosphate etherase
MHTDRGHLLTEQRNVQSATIDRMSIEEGFDVLNAEDATIAQAVAAARADICLAVEAAVRSFERGGRLIYVGAGTSGRLGVIDAAECPPTFMTPPDMVQGVIAGGFEAMVRSIEGAEDCPDAARGAIADRDVGARDTVFGIASGGTTPFVHAALDEAAARGARTVFLACVPREQCPDEADISIRLLTGPEVVTGSTRMKAGTATKMALNMVSTLSMIRLGKVYGNLMVDLNREACAKLQDRAVRVVVAATGLERPAAQVLLDAAEDVKTAIVMHHRAVDAASARDLLDAQGGVLQNIVDIAD